MRWLIHNIDRISTTLLLVCGGAGLGMAASSLTNTAVVWKGQSSFAVSEPVAEAAPIDHFASGRQWAQAAFDGGLRRCPPMNADFLAGCDAEMKALTARPDVLPGSYGGPLLITTYEPPTPEAYEEAPIVEAPPRPSRNPDAYPSENAPEAAFVPASFEPTPDNYPAGASPAE